MKPEVKKLILSNLPYLIFVYLFGKLGAGIPAGGRCGLVGKAAAFHGRLFGGLCKRPPPASTLLTC